MLKNIFVSPADRPIHQSHTSYKCKMRIGL